LGCFRVFAIVAGLLLLLPGACFVLVGFGSLGSPSRSDAIGFVATGVVILAAAIGLFFAAASRGRRPPLE
jgi:hypothetical protein